MLIKEVEKTHGMWISATGPSHGKIDTVWFRRTFSCPDDRQLRVKVSACSRYKCYLNGRFVCYGPCKGGHSYQFFDDVDLSGFLVPGENELLFEVVSFPDHPDPDTVPGPDWCVSLLPYASLAVIGSDMATDLPGWTWYRCSAVTPILNTVARWLGYTEEVRTEKAVSLSDTASLPWEPTKTAASVFGDDWGGLPCLPAYERPIPLLELCDPIFLTTDSCGKKVFADGSLTVPPHTHLTLDLDAGEHVTAFVTFAGTKGTGARVTLLYAEGYLHPDGKGNFVKNDRLPGSDGILSGYSDTVIPGGTDFSYTPFLIRTFRYLRMDIVTTDEPLILFSPSYRITRYPLTAISAVGEDSPAWISDIWGISLRTLRNCMHETFEDCPYYEQMQYAMDTRLEMLFAYRLSGETAIQKRTIFDYQASQFPSGALSSRAPVSMLQIIPSFSLYWILMLCDYYMQTGDISVLRDCFGTVDRILCYFRSKIGKSGLIETPGYWEFIDWVDA